MAKDKRKQGNLSRRRFIQRTAAAAGGIWLMPGAHPAQPAASPSNRPAHPDPDLILVNGKIHTMDANNTIASAVVVKDGRFIEVGHAARVQRGPETVVIDLRGRTVVPGIIDNHNHLVLMGNRPGHHTPLENAYSIADVQDIYRARAAGVPNGEWITTIGGFHFNHIYGVPGDKRSGRFPTRQELDAAVPNHPVFASISFNGPATTNTLGKNALEAVGITVADNGAIAAPSSTQPAATGAPGALLHLRQTLLTPETRRRGVIDAMTYAASVGVTTHIDQGAFQATNTAADGAAHEDNFTMHIPFLEIYDQGLGKVRLRINFLHMESDPETPELRQRLKNAFPFLGDDMVKTGGIGEFIAQGTGSTFLQAARRVAQARWRAEVHSLTRTDFQQEIQAFETVNGEFPITALRWVVAHVPFITGEYVDRLHALGGGLSLTGWRYLAGTPASNGPPFRMIVDKMIHNGINAGMSSDGMQIAPMNPWIHMYYAVTGKNARDDVINAGQQITRQEVLSLYTRQNKWFVREEDLGSIEPGNRADLLVLNADYFSTSAVPDEDIKKVRPVLTVVAGNIQYDERLLDVRKG